MLAWCSLWENLIWDNFPWGSLLWDSLPWNNLPRSTLLGVNMCGVPGSSMLGFDPNPNLCAGLNWWGTLPQTVSPLASKLAITIHHIRQHAIERKRSKHYRLEPVLNPLVQFQIVDTEMCGAKVWYVVSVNSQHQKEIS